MDLDSIEALNQIRPSEYRAAMKIMSVQKHCYMHVVPLRQLLPALRCLDDVQKQEVNREEVTRVLSKMFVSVSQEVPGQVTLQAPEITCQLLFYVYQPGGLFLRSVETALILLSGDTLPAKHRALVSVAERGSVERGLITRSSLRTLLEDLRQVLVAVQEGSEFGSVEAAVESCFRGVLSAGVQEDHVLSWLQGQPRLLLWLPTLYRLSASQSVTHAVRCHACKSSPITGLRYRCMKCVNLHLCQSCFLTDRQTKKHKTTHLVLEYCTQPSWRESLASLAHNARHNLLPRRYTRREAMSGRSMVWAGPAPPDAPPQVVDSSVSQRPCSTASSHDAAGPPVATQEVQTHPQVDMVMVKDIKDLQRDRWLLEKELQVLRVTVQSEQGILEDRCLEMEVTMETLRQHNVQLQQMLSQSPGRTERVEEEEMPQQVEEEEEEEGEEKEEEWAEVTGEEQANRKETDFDMRTPSPTKHWGTSSDSSEEEVVFEGPLSEPIKRLDLVNGEESETQALLSGPVREMSAETEHHGRCSQAEEDELLLLALVKKTKSALCLNTHTHSQEHAHTHAHTHSQEHAHTHSQEHAHTHSQEHAHTHSQEHTHTHSQEHAHTHTHSQEHAHTHTDSQEHTHQGWGEATGAKDQGAVMKMRLLEAAEEVQNSLASLVSMVTH